MLESRCDIKTIDPVSGETGEPECLWARTGHIIVAGKADGGHQPNRMSNRYLDWEDNCPNG